MDSATIQRILQVLSAIYDTATPAEQRKEAEQICDSIKNDKDSALTYGLYLANHNNNLSPTAQYFGLQLIEHGIRHHIRDQKDTLAVRDSVWQLVINVAPDSAQFIREKLVSVFVMLVIRLWPSSKWLDFNSQISQLYGASLVHREIALRIWQTLGEELFVYERDATATVRKSELTNGIIGSLLPLRVVEELYPSGFRATTDPMESTKKGSKKKKALMILVEPGNEDGWIVRWLNETAHNQNDAAYVSALLDTIEVYLNWIPIRALAATQLAQRIASLLDMHSDSVRKKAAQCLAVLARRSTASGEERDTIALQFAHANDAFVVRALTQAYATTSPQTIEAQWEDTAEALETAKLIAQTAGDIVAFHWAKKKLTENVLPDPQALIGLLVALCQDRWFSVVAIALPAWAAIIRHQTLRTLPEVTCILSTLTEHATNLLFSVCRAANRLNDAERSGEDDAVTCGVSDDEAVQFESLTELRTFLLSEVRSRLMGLICSISTTDAPGFVNWLIPSVVPVLTQHLNTTNGRAVDQDQSSVVEAALIMTDTVFSTLARYEQQGLEESDEHVAGQIEAARAPCHRLGESIVGFVCDDTALVSRQLQTLPALAFLMRTSAMSAESRTLLLSVLHKCTAYLRVDAQSPQVREWRQVARRATSALVRLALEIPDSLMEMYGEIAQTVNECIGDVHVPNTTKSYMAEFQLTLIAGATLTVSKKHTLSEPIICPLIESLREITPMLESPQTFLTLLGFFPALDRAFAYGIDEETRNALTEAKNARHKMMYITSTLHICLARTLNESAHSLAAVWREYLAEIARPLLLMVRCVHALWNKDYWSTLPWASREAHDLFGVLGLSHAEKSAILGVSVPEPIDSESRLAIEVRAMQHTLSTLRESLYKSIGLLAHIPEFTSDAAMGANASQNFSGCMFADAPSMIAKHWKMALTDVVQPVLKAVGNWPGRRTDAHSAQNVKDIAGFVPAWLGPLSGFCTERLDNEWKNTRSTSNAPSNDESLNDDIVHEKVLRDWTRAWSETVAYLLHSIASWFPESAQLENELASSSRITITSHQNTRDANKALGSFVIASRDTLSLILGSALHALQYADSQACSRVLSVISRIAPALCVVGIVAQYAPPTPAHASVAQNYVARVDAGALAGVFVWLGDDLVAAMCGVLRDPKLIDLQDAALGVIAALVYASACISHRMPVTWPRKHADGTEEPGAEFRGRVVRQLGALGVDAAVAVEQVREEADAKRRRALLRVALDGVVATDRGRMFKDEGRVGGSGGLERREVGGAWTNRMGGASESVVESDEGFDLGKLMP